MTDSRSGFGSLHMPRSRGAVSGLLLIILGVWGALIPFVGPYFPFAYTADHAWAWSTARGWLEVFPGATTAAGGVLLLISGNRATAMLGGWLAVIGGAWFVVGRTLASTLRPARRGSPDGLHVAAGRGRSADRCDGRQACCARDRLLLRPRRTDRLPRWSGLGANVGPEGARPGIRAGEPAGSGHRRCFRGTGSIPRRPDLPGAADAPAGKGRLVPPATGQRRQPLSLTP